MYQHLVLWAWLEIFFTPKRYQFQNNTLSDSIFFQLNTLKSTVKAPAMDLLRLNTVRVTKTPFLTPERYDETPGPFCRRVSSGFSPFVIGG